MDWSALGFNYYKTDWNVRFHFTDGKWSEMEVTDDEYIKMHMSASCLHYGIELFEGLKPSVVLTARCASSVSTRMHAVCNLRPSASACRCRVSR
mgnify:CR=1 FL=1